MKRNMEEFQHSSISRGNYWKESQEKVLMEFRYEFLKESREEYQKEVIPRKNNEESIAGIPNGVLEEIQADISKGSQAEFLKKP